MAPLGHASRGCPARRRSVIRSRVAEGFFCDTFFGVRIFSVAVHERASCRNGCASPARNQARKVLSMGRRGGWERRTTTDGLAGFARPHSNSTAQARASQFITLTRQLGFFCLQRGSKVFMPRSLGLPDTTEFGASTIAALAKARDVDELVHQYLDIRDRRFNAIAKAKPKNAKFLKGWHNRVSALRKYLAGISSSFIIATNRP